MAIAQQQIDTFKRIHEQPQRLRLSRFYGIDHAVKQYLNLPDWFPLAMVAYLEHGINFKLDFVTERMLNASRDIIFMDNAYRVSLLPKAYKAYPLGPPFILARRTHGIEQQVDARGTLAYPVHSSHTISFGFDWQEYAESLANLPDFMQPVTACIYWMDILKGRHEIFEEFGIEVITNGHMLDPEFAIRCVQNMSGFKYQTGNSVTSAAFYGLDMNIPFFLHGHEKGIDPSNKAFRQMINAHPYMQRIQKCLSFDRLADVQVGSEQKSLLADYLDEENWISAKAAKKIVLQHSASVLVNKGIHELKKKMGLASSQAH